MSGWKYCRIDLNNMPRKTDDVDLLNGAGEQGWELVTITVNSIAYFKRSLDEQAPAPTRRKSASSSAA
jgi:hypothetical protein